jgi:hypothetical protein
MLREHRSQMGALICKRGAFLLLGVKSAFNLGACALLSSKRAAKAVALRESIVALGREGGDAVAELEQLKLSAFAGGLFGFVGGQKIAEVGKLRLAFLKLCKGGVTLRGESIDTRVRMGKLVLQLLTLLLASIRLAFQFKHMLPHALHLVQ